MRNFLGAALFPSWYMRRALVVLLAALLPAAPAYAQEGPPPLRATLAACESGPDPSERFAVFTGSMPAAVGTRRMLMRFDLLQRREGARRWSRVRATAFGRWERSGERRAGFIYTKRVERLKQRHEYRAVVRFRWVREDGTVQRERRRRTPTCVQPWQRPDLRVELIEVLDGRYRVTVVNEGIVEARASTLGIVADGEDLVHEVPALAAGERTTVEVAGPRCSPRSMVAVRVDVRGVVKESDERDNRSERPCEGR